MRKRVAVAGPRPSPFPHKATALSCGVIGAGGHAGVAVEALGRQGVAVVALFEQIEAARIAADGLPIRHDIAAAVSEGLPLHIGVGSNETRRRLATEFGQAQWLSAVDPRALVAEGATWEEGCLITMGAMVQVRARLGRHVIVNTGAIVEHDVTIGDFAHLAPGAIVTGGAQIGDGVLIGAGAVILPGVTVGDWAIVGAGSIVTRPVAAGETVVGAPSRPLNTPTP